MATPPVQHAEDRDALARQALPDDGAATLIGRAWLPAANDAPAGPSPIAVRDGAVFDLAGLAPTVSMLLALPDLAARVEAARPPEIAAAAEVIANSHAGAIDPTAPYLLAPVDLQVVKAAGVTFAASLLERVIEEQARGDKAAADTIRAAMAVRIGADLSRVRPGTPAAARLREALVEAGMWSPYLEVGIGRDAEIFTKAPPLATVGYGTEIGILAASDWNNPEPEIVMIVNGAGTIVGAALGNDVNLRDIEGRSALLLGRAKDNNASCAIGPFIRLFDAGYTIDDVRGDVVALSIIGADGFTLEATSSMAEISRDVADLVGQTIGPEHQYPDGLALFTGTMFAPTADRDAPGEGFTHHVGDVVEISSPRLGTLSNRVGHCDQIDAWTFGVAELMANLAARGLL